MEKIMVMPHYHHPALSQFKLVQPDWECALCGRSIAGGYPWVGCTVFTGFFPTKNDKHYMGRMKKRGYDVKVICEPFPQQVNEIDQAAGDALYAAIYGSPAPDAWYPKVPHKYKGRGDTCDTCKLPKEKSKELHKKKHWS